jgi:hypothetical protein
LEDQGRLQDPALADDDGPIFSTVAKLVDALKRSIPEGTRNAELKQEALCLAGCGKTIISHSIIM